MFVLWHHLCRTALPLLVVIGGSLLFLPDAPSTHWLAVTIRVLVLSFGTFTVLLTLALLFFKFRFSCPHCHGKKTAFGIQEKHFWLNCDDCGLTEETGFLKRHLKFTPKAELEDAP